jgi:hypothetical protein
MADTPQEAKGKKEAKVEAQAQEIFPEYWHACHRCGSKASSLSRKPAGLSLP